MMATHKLPRLLLVTLVTALLTMNGHRCLALSANSRAENEGLPPLKVEQQGRDIYAIGDLHGDFDVTKTILTKLGLINSAHNWVGGKTIVVQLGDQLDKGVGNGDREVIDLMAKLHSQAQLEGGAVYSLLGNHEFLNLSYNFKKVDSKNAFSAFTDIAGPTTTKNRYGVKNPIALPNDRELRDYTSKDPKGRFNAFKPGGKFADILANRPVVLIIGDSLFVHASLLPDALKYGDSLAAINTDTRQWILGYDKDPPKEAAAIFNFLDNDMSPIFDHTSSGDKKVDQRYCDGFTQVLAELHLKRIVKGHDVQKHGINSACNGKIWRVDVGLSAFYVKDRKFPERWQVLKITANGSEPQIVK